MFKLNVDAIHVLNV